MLLASVPEPLNGDYNLNGVVDPPDYNVWRDSFGKINAADYNVWRDSFNEHIGTSAPEPSGIALSLLGAISVAWAVPRRRLR